MNKKLWLTYAWKDNEDKNIDFIINELSKTSLIVKFDRKNLIPGQRLWTQIGGIITDPNECDAWGLVLTNNSLNSQACIEELSYALDRALSTKDESFPMFALLKDISFEMLPPSLKVRLGISLEEDNWVNKVIAAVNKVSVGFESSEIRPFILTVYSQCLEIRPRLERIAPFVVAVDIQEQVSGNVIRCTQGPAKQIPVASVKVNSQESNSKLSDGTDIYYWKANNEASSINSYYLFFKNTPPKRIWVGHPDNLIPLNIED